MSNNHISTEDGTEIVRTAKKKGIPITAETCPHYFTLTEDAVERYNTHAKMKPPLRSKRDRAAILEGLADGTLDIIASDHAPHHPHSKEKEFSQAPFGIIGLETIFSLTYDELVLKKVISPLEAVAKLTDNPARAFRLPGGSLSEGSPADIAIFDPKMLWTVGGFASKSMNSPFIGRRLQGRVVTTIVGGKTVYKLAP